MRIKHSVYFEEETWDELIQWAFTLTAAEMRPVTASELVRSGVERELAVLRADHEGEG